MAISDDRQRYMPLPDDREPERGQPLAYPEAVKLINPIEPEFKGEVLFLNFNHSILFFLLINVTISTSSLALGYHMKK